MSRRIDRGAIAATVLVFLCALGVVPQCVPALAGAAVGCVGDCDGCNAVTIDELVAGVNIALGVSPLDRCPSFDCAGNGVVTIDCLIRAVKTSGFFARAVRSVP